MNLLKTAFVFLKHFAHDLNDTKISVYAGSLVYITLLSLVPTLALSFSILHGLGVQNQLEPLLLELLAPIGERSGEVVSSILQFVNNTSVQALGMLGVGMILYSGISMVLKLEFALNQIWGVKETRSIFRRISYYLTMLLLGPVTFFISMAFMGSIDELSFMKPLLEFQYFSVPYYFLINIVPFLIIVFALFMLYMVVPNHPVTAKSAIYAAIITALSWKLSGWVFSMFIATSVNYNIIYSSFAVVIIFIVWIYMTWLIILAGAMVCSQIQYAHFRIRRDLQSLNFRNERMIRVLILFKICRAYFSEQNPVTVADLVDYAKLPVHDIYKILDEFNETKLIILARKKERQVVLPGSKINVLSLGEVLTALDISEQEIDELLLGENITEELELIIAWYKRDFDHSQSLTEIFISQQHVALSQDTVN